MTTDLPTTTLAIFGLPSGAEWFIILAVGLLLFGRRLPEVGRSLGQGIVEFKKGLKGVQDEVNTAGDGNAYRAPSQKLPEPTPNPNPTSLQAESRAADKVS
jgi:sec-independent protein translocase protein TatA